MLPDNNIVTIKNILLLFLGIVGILVIKELSGLLIPLVFAIFIGIVLQPAIAYLDRKNWPYMVSIIVITVLSLGFVFLIGLIVFDTGLQIVDQKEKLLTQIGNKLNGLVLQFDRIPGFEALKERDFRETLNQLFSAEMMLNASGTIASEIGSFIFNLVLSAIYLVAVLGSIVQYEKYINYLEGDDDVAKQRLLKGFVEVKDAVASYMKVKFFTSLCTGIFFSLICWAFGLDFVIFWGFFAFILNFIPTVGSIIATIPPLLLGLIQIDNGAAYLLFIVLIIATQFTWGNIIEPLMMGTSLALNTVTVILGLVIWGYIWGIAGMLLSVPLIVLARVILAQIPDADLIVKLMGRSQLKKGDLL
jgi:predicted PurR-regulated permease PerM